MIEVKGDLFETEHKIIGHGVNCKGVMGAGVAAVVRLKYPYVFEVYKELCDRKGLKPGQMQAAQFDEDRIIVNMATQDRPGPDAKYDHVLNAALSALDFARYIGEDFVAIPKIGSGIGALNWEAVALILQAAEKVIDGPQFVVYIQ